MINSCLPPIKALLPSTSQPYVQQTLSLFLIIYAFQVICPSHSTNSFLQSFYFLPYLLSSKENIFIHQNKYSPKLINHILGVQVTSYDRLAMIYLSTLTCLDALKLRNWGGNLADSLYNKEGNDPQLLVKCSWLRADVPDHNKLLNVTPPPPPAPNYQTLINAEGRHFDRSIS